MFKLGNHYDIQKVSWYTHEAILSAIREQVFIVEQHVPVTLELDGLDQTALHLLALNNKGEPIGCTRLLGDGSIGRMAVLKPWRGLGVGKALLQMAVLHYQQQSIQPITLSAQMHAIPFYQKTGFEVCSEPYLDAGMFHVDMQLGQHLSI
ncbi:MAG: GNAT family N-acetyltransferase [Methylotenera sp.]|nr:GNAT family N-acetyltransferase [Methylotenera sp.]